jgi:hypothetical protein
LRAQLVLKGLPGKKCSLRRAQLNLRHRLADLPRRRINHNGSWYSIWFVCIYGKHSLWVFFFSAVALEHVKPPTPQQQDCIRQIILAGFGDHVARYTGCSTLPCLPCVGLPFRPNTPRR